MPQKNGHRRYGNGPRPSVEKQHPLGNQPPDLLEKVFDAYIGKSDINFYVQSLDAHLEGIDAHLGVVDLCIKIGVGKLEPRGPFLLLLLLF